MSDILDDDDTVVVDGNDAGVEDNSGPDNVVIENQADFVSTVFQGTQTLILDQLSLRAEENVVFAQQLSSSMEKADEIELFITKDSVEVTISGDDGTVNWSIS